jgi:O-antigen/teichoic acid export membrane protein
MTLARRVVSATTQLTLSNAFVRALSIITMPVLTALLSPEAYGVAALAGTIISLVSVFGLAGIDMSYSRAYYSEQPPNGQRVEHYCWRFAIFGALVCGVIGALVWQFLVRDALMPDAYVAPLVALGVVCSVMCAMAQTRARLAGRYRALALATIATGVLCAAASICIALWQHGALALLVPMLLGYLLPVLILGTPSIATLTQRSRLIADEGSSLVKIGLAGVVTAPMYWLLSSSDRWFIQHYHGAAAVGVYSVGYSVAVAGTMINTAITAVWLPEAAREYEQDRVRAQATLGRLLYRLAAMMALVWLLAAAAGGDVVRWLANQRFHAAADCVPYIAGGVFFYGISQLAFYGLVLIKQAQWGAFWWVVGGLLSAALNWAMVPKYGLVGAAFVQSASFAFIALVLLLTSQAKYPLQLSWGRLSLLLASTFAAALLLAKPWHAGPLVSLLLKAPIVALVAGAVAWMVAPDWCTRAIGQLRSAGALRQR